MIFTKDWLKAAAIRAIKTVAQTAIATIGTTALISEVNWLAVLSASLLAGILSLLTSLAGLPEVEQDKGCITVLAYENYDENGDPVTANTAGDDVEDTYDGQS